MNFLKKIAALPGNILLLGLVSFFTDVSSEMIYPLLPLFIIQLPGIGVGFLGLIEGVAESTAALLKLYSGIYSDRVKRKKPLVLLGYGVSTLARPLVGFAVTGSQVFSIRFLDRVGKGIRSSPRDALISLIVNPKYRGFAFGLHRAMDHSGAVMGPVVASVILYFFAGEYRTVFLFSFIPGIIAFLVLYLFVHETSAGEKPIDTVRSKEGAHVKPHSLFRKSELKAYDKRFYGYLLSVLLFTMGNSSDAFILLRASRSGISSLWIPVLWGYLHVIKAVISVIAGYMSDSGERRRYIILGWMVYAFVYLGFAYVENVVQIWVLFTVYGFYYGMTEGVEKAFVADLVSEERRGSAYGLYHFAIGITAFPASLLFGLLAEHISMAFAFIWSAGLAGLAILVLWFFTRGLKPETK